MKKGEKYVETHDLNIIEFEFYTPDGSGVFKHNRKSFIIPKKDLGKVIEIPERPKHLAELLNMEEMGDCYIHNGKIISEFELRVMYDLIFMTKVELFNKLLGR